MFLVCLPVSRYIYIERERDQKDQLHIQALYVVFSGNRIPSSSNPIPTVGEPKGSYSSRAICQRGAKNYNPKPKTVHPAERHGTGS